MKFSELQRLQRREGITVLSADERIEQLEARLRTVTKERDAMRARITQMEKQAPVRWGCTVLQVDRSWKEEIGIEEPPKDYFSIRNAFPLYALPGAKGEEK